ncbi:MAG: aminotransferase class III-fold pyridoxal phosphate-dependent enzyme, partial [Bdellovibrionales bacterium]|nr:aminotransferase class III-fold pyridoxal phosphate-dependent enzyme [Bdellovibrionales bacterium]
VYSSVDKSFVHASTFSENSLAMRAALATLDVVENEDLESQSLKKGEYLRAKLRDRLLKYEIVQEVRGLGLMNGIVFQPPKSLALKMLYGSFRKAHPGLFGQMVVRTLFNEHHVLCQMAGNEYSVIKSMPPLIISEAQLDRYVDAFESVVKTIINEKTKFWPQGLDIAAKAFAAKVGG